MTAYEDEQDLEVTPEQIEMLRELGVDPTRIEGMSMAEAEDLIDELRAERNPTKTGGA
jgi:hypothetical protein